MQSEQPSTHTMSNTKKKDVAATTELKDAVKAVIYEMIDNNELTLTEVDFDSESLAEAIRLAFTTDKALKQEIMSAVIGSAVNGSTPAKAAEIMQKVVGKKAATKTEGIKLKVKVR